MWWKKSYIHRRDWILENLKSLKLSSSQVLVVLMIDFMNEFHEAIDLDALSVRTGLTPAEIDVVIRDLQHLDLLTVKVQSNHLSFSLDALYEHGVPYENLDESIFEVFEAELGRLMSQQEMEMLNSWLGKYGREAVIEALRSAIMVQKVSMKYMNAILAKQKNA